MYGLAKNQVEVMLRHKVILNGVMFSQLKQLVIMAKKTMFGLVKILVEIMLKHKAILNGVIRLKLKPLVIMKK